MDRSSIEPLIAALDAAVPKDEARVVIRQYGGGPDECTIVANERGYLRLGIEMLKAAYAPTGYMDQADAVHVDLDDVIHDDSEIQLDWFERRDPEAPATDSTWRLGDLAAMACGLFLVGMFTIGCIASVMWIGSLFQSRP